MAQIKKNDIIENGIFDNAVQSSQELLKLMDSLDKEFMKVSNSAKAVKQNLDFGKVSDIDKFIKLEQEMAGQFRQTTELMKKRKTVQDQLRAATDEEVKGKLRLKQATAEQRKELKLELELEKAQVGTLKRLRLVNKQLREEKERLNLTTKEGKRRLREINAEINRNNAVLEKNATQLGKQKIGIGRYSQAISKNILRYAGWTAAISLLTRALRSASRDVIGFDKAQADLAGVLGKSRKEITLLTRDAKRLGATTIFKPKEVSALQKEFAKLGFGVSQIQNMTKATLDFATATNTDLAQSAEIVGNTLNAFQLGSEETTRVVNVMNESFTRSALDSERFSLAMGKVGAVATQAGMSLERTTATLGILVSNGIKAETAGTGLRNILLKVSETGEDLDTVLKEVNGSTDRVAAATKRFGSQNAAVALTMATMQKESEDLTKQLEKQGRTAESVAKEQMNTLSGSLKQLSSAWDGFILSLEEGDGWLSRVFTKLVNYHTWLLEGQRKFISSSKDLFSEVISSESLKQQEAALEEVNDIIGLIGKSTQELIDLDNELTSTQRQNAKKIIELRKQGLKEIEITSKLLGGGFRDKKSLDEAEDLLNKQLEIFEKHRDNLEEVDEKAKENEFKSSFAALAKQRTLLGQHLDTIKKAIKNSSNEELDILKNSSDEKIALEAQYEIARRKLNNQGTEEDGKENKKRLDNYKRYLEEKYRLEVQFRQLIQQLDRDFDSISNERENQLNDLKLKNLEKEIDKEKELQLERAEQGLEVDLTNLNTLFEEKKKVLEETARLQQDLDRKTNHQNYKDQLEDIEELYQKRIENLDKLNAKQSEYDKAEIERKAALERAKRNFETEEDIIDTRGDSDRKEAREEVLKETEDFYGDLEDAQQKHNDEMDKLRDEQLKAEEEANQKRLEQRQELFDGLEAIGQAFAEREQERINKELENIDLLLNKSRERVNQLRQNSSENRQTIESNIAFEEAKQAQLEKQRLEAEKKQRQIELATTAVEVYSNKVKNDDPNPLVNTIKDITLLQQFVKNIPLFWEGTDTTVGAALGAPHLNTARDGYIVRVDKNEKILNPHLSAMTGNMTTQEIAEAAYNYRMGITDYTNPFDLSNQSASVANVVNNNSTYLLMQEISKQNSRIDETNDKLQELINKPVSSMFLDDTGAIPKIVQRTVQGNKTINQKRMLR